MYIELLIDVPLAEIGISNARYNSLFAILSNDAPGFQYGLLVW